MRSILSLFAKSPFVPLEEHVRKVKECADMLRECMDAYCKGEFEKAEKIAGEIFKKEREADDIKNAIRESLPRNIFMPVNRGDFLDYLGEQDKVADKIEDVAITLTLKRTKIPGFKGDLLELTRKACDTADVVPLAVNSLNELIKKSFKATGESKCEKYIEKLNLKERKVDHLETKMRKDLFDSEDKLTYGEFYHLLRVVKLLGRIADHAENCGDRMRVMIARQ